MLCLISLTACNLEYLLSSDEVTTISGMLTQHSGRNLSFDLEILNNSYSNINIGNNTYVFEYLGNGEWSENSIIDVEMPEKMVVEPGESFKETIKLGPYFEDLKITEDQVFRISHTFTYNSKEIEVCKIFTYY